MKQVKHFVWVEGVAGPTAQIWHMDGGKDGQGKLKSTLKLVELPSHDQRALDELKGDYPL
jgi:hypothetical protein